MNLKEVLLGIKNWGENKFASKEDLENLVGPGINFKVVNSLPPVSEGDSKVLYLVGPVGAGADKYEEFIFSDSQYVMIGDTSVDLSNYVTSSQLESSLEGVLRVTDVYEWAKAENKPSYDYSEIANAPSNVSDFTNDAGYLTSHQDISGKQDVIADLDEIRAGAALGSSALQSHQDISGKQDTIADLDEIRSGAALGASALQAHQDISGKQDVIDDLDEIRSGAVLGATAYQKPASGIPASDLADGVITGNVGYELPEGGIPKSDLAASVQSSLDKAESALQEHQDISGKANVGDSYTKEEVDSLLDDIKNPKEESDSYDYIYDEASWNASFESGALRKYYTKYPDEDRYNTQEHRWAWAVDKVDGEWPEWCVQCWEGAVNANAAKFPWICPNFDDDVNSKIIFRYEGKSDVYPWGENVFGIGRKADGSDRLWGIASVAEEFGDKGFLIPENQNNGEESWSGEVGANNFDISKFTMILVKQSDDLKAYVNANFQPKGEYITEHQDISGKANISDLSEVATSGSYNDLFDKPEIPSLSGYATESYVNEKFEDAFGINAQGVSEIAAVLNDNDAATGILSAISEKADRSELFSGSYNDLSDKPAIPEVPTNVSAFTNDAGYLTSHQDISGKQDVIDDLAEIRSGAALGATAIQSHQDISGKQDIIADLDDIRSGATLGASAYQKPASGIPASDIEDGVIPQIDLSDYVTTEALNSAVLLESGDGANSLIQKGNNNAVAFGANSTAFGTSSTNAKDRGITSESTVETIVSEWVGSDPEDDKFALTLGEGSHIEGNNCLALGKNSHAEGNGTIAGNNSSHAEGTGSKATGKYAHAEGLETVAEGSRSHAEGYSTIALLDETHAEGQKSEANARASHAEGYNSITSKEGYDSNTLEPKAQGTGTSSWKNSCSHAEGNATIAQGLGAHAEGEKTFANNRTAHAEGLETIASGAYASHAEGEATIASGEDSHAEGYKTKANALSAHTEGNRTVINEGGRSHTEGYGTYASGIGAHSEGINGYYIVLQRVGNSGNVYDIRQIEDMTPADALAAGKYPKVGDLNAEDGKTIKSVDTENHTITMSGNWGGNNKWSRLYFIINDIEDTSLRGNDGALDFATHSEGVHTKANGWGSHAEGEMAVANGDTSHAEGWRTTTENQCEHAQGQYNVSHKASGTFGDAGNTIHSVGIGNRTDNYGNGDRKNAVEIMQNGDAYLYGIGGYDGVSLSGASTLKQVIDSKGTYSKPSAGIPASDLASGVIPDVSGLETRVGNIESQLEGIETLLASI